MSAALSIVFTGLCALVTDGDRAPGQVLLVDTRSIGEVGGVALPEHAPTLVANLGILSNPESSNPTRIVTAWPGQGLAAADRIGLWDLKASEVRIRIQGREGTGLQLYQPPPGGSSWPDPPRGNDPESWRDLRFLASMKALTGDGRIDPALVVVDDAASTTLPRGVATRIHLDAGRLEAGVPSEELHRGDVFEFTPGRVGPSQRQALTDTVRWSLETGDAAAVIEIVPVNGGPVKRLVLAPNAKAHDLFVSNLPTGDSTHDAHHAMSSEEMVFPHFGAYYKLLMNEPDDKPQPILWLAPMERRGTGGGRPMFCGPAVFNRR